ncbi:hypothetical protein PPEP_a0547 [Pseudoalteromonas peptidolytica F12-50-A1]|uniref:Uncharacterized protein n=1 Tax=Pseudoalteromonas peptidolytica F12-50-A1 TaxID=1315280 RepID=A0A8I0T4X6_9GAMM|nr:hypothetical protein [Pseudoalteromonas peptidolytica F12-50-A1]
MAQLVRVGSPRSGLVQQFNIDPTGRFSTIGWVVYLIEPVLSYISTYC